MNHYLANESFLLGNNPTNVAPALSGDCSCSNYVFTGRSVKDNIVMSIKSKEENYNMNNNMLLSTDLFEFYSTQQPAYYNDNNYFMTANSLSSSCSPPPLLSPEFNNTGLYYNNTDTADNDNSYFYNTPIEYPLIKPESLTYSTATTGINIGNHERHVSPESTCSVSSVIDKKVFSCNYCNRSFARKYDVARHKRIHTGVKPYVCPCCSKGFSRSDARVRHFRTETMCRDGAERIGKQRRSHIKTCSR